MANILDFIKPDHELSKFIDFNINIDNYSINNYNFFIYLNNISFIASLDKALEFNLDIINYLAKYDIDINNNLVIIFISNKNDNIQNINLSKISNILTTIKQDIIIFAQENSHAIIDFKNIVNNSIIIQDIKVILAQNSNTTFIADQQLDNNSILIQNSSYFLEKNSSLIILEFCNSGTSYLNKNFNLVGDYSTINNVGFYSLSSNNRTAIITQQNHKALSTNSNIDIKSVLKDSSKFFYRGTIFIDTNANQSEADQQHKALLLDKSVQACSIPSLEVKTEDIKCAHGSAMGDLNQDYIWYLQSRGLDYNQAAKFIINGFLSNYSLSDNINNIIQEPLDRVKNII